MRRIALAFVTLTLMAPVPASAQHKYFRPKRAVPMLDGCNQSPGYPNCHADRTYTGRSVAISARPAFPGPWGYDHYAYGPNCLRYGYPPNCAYWELPDWNGGMEIRNPGGG